MLKIVDFYNLTKNAKKSKIVNFLYFHFDHVKAKGAGGGQFFYGRSFARVYTVHNHSHMYFSGSCWDATMQETLEWSTG